MSEIPALAHPEIQAELLAEAVRSATVGFLVWDEDRRYIAANQAAREILGTSLPELLGQRVGEHTEEGDRLMDAIADRGFAYGEATVERFDGSGRVKVFYATFTTQTARMPFMATLLSRVME